VTDEEGNSFRTRIAIVIAVVSIFGAITAWRGTLISSAAAGADHQYLDEVAERQERVNLLSALVAEDVRQVGPYEEHVRAAALLRSEASQEGGADSALADSLLVQARGEDALAAERRTFIRYGTPEVTSDQAHPVKYDAAAALRTLELNDSQLQKLRPDVLLVSSEALHRKSLFIVGLVSMFVASLFFLTLAQFTGPGPRRIFFASGVGVAVLTIVLWVSLEVFL